MSLKTKTSNYASAIGNWICSPPYNGVPWLVWLYVLAACLICNSGGVWAGYLASFDDYVRMHQALNWVNGAGWYDRTIMRVNPPEGFTTIWARIVDIPIAAVILVAQRFTDQRNAALIASVVIPFVELAVLMQAARYFARPLVGKNKAWLVVMFLMFTTVLNLKRFSISGFHTGQASHHPYYIILVLLMFGASGRMAIGAPGRKAAYMMGCSVALLLAVGIEGFPLIAGACALLTCIAWYYARPKVALRGMQGMALGATGSLILLPLHQPPAHFFDISFAEPSILGPILMAVAALYLGVVWFIVKLFGLHRQASLLNIVGAAIAFFVLLVLAFPQIKDGPAAGLSPDERAMARLQHTEAQPMYEVTSSTADFIGLLMPTVIALGAGIIAMRNTRNMRRRSMYAAYFGFTAMTGAMTEFLSRYVHHAMMTVCPWLVWAWEEIKKRMPKNRNYSLKALGVFVILGPFWLLLLPAIQSDGGISTKILFYPAKHQSVLAGCDIFHLSKYIDDHYGPQTNLIVPYWDSSRFLYFTDVVIDFLALYPSHDRFKDNEVFFQTKNPDEAKKIAREHHIDLAAVCSLPAFGNASVPADQKKMIGRLQIDEVPGWLKKVDTGDPGYYVLYEIDKKALEQQ